MAQHLTPWTRALLDTLSDDQWHDRRALCRQIAPIVPEGLTNKSQNRHVQHTLAQMIYRGRVELAPDRRQVRITDDGHRVLLKEDGVITESRPASYSFAAKKMFEILSDGAKHRYAEVLEQISRVVPPEKGYRTEAVVRERQAEKRRREGQAQRKQTIGMSLHEAGQRRIAAATLHGFLERKKIVVEHGMVWLNDATE